jgi:hypothetical protein
VVLMRVTTVGEDGERRMEQVDPRFPDGRPEGPAEPTTGPQPRSALRERQAVRSLEDLKKNIYNIAAAHVNKRIEALVSVEQLRAVRELEEAHPKYEGGRVTVLDFINERERALLGPEAPPPPEDPTAESGGLPDPHPEALMTVAEGIPCEFPDCHFSAGSEEGMQAHIAAHHATDEL